MTAEKKPQDLLKPISDSLESGKVDSHMIHTFQILSGPDFAN